MKKSERISGLVARAAGAPPGGADPRLAAFFALFNTGAYYEAHDVLEDLWLETKGSDRAFFQGLIQLAGAFVHLQKHFGAPAHPKHARRLHPAARLFALAEAKLSPFQPRCHALAVTVVCVLCRAQATALAASGHRTNPWHPEHLPHLPWPAP